MTRLLLFAGRPASGKSTALRAVENIGVPTLEMSTVAKWKYEQYSGRDPRPNEVLPFAANQKQIHGRGIFGHQATRYIEERMGSPLEVAVGGIRSPEEVEEFRKWTRTSRLYFVESDADERFNRLKKRSRPGEEEYTRDDFDHREGIEESWGVSEVEDMADEVLVNDLDERDFRQVVIGAAEAFL